MAEVSHICRFNHRRQEEFEMEGELYISPSAFVDFDSFCLPNNFAGTFILDDNAAASFDLGGEPWSPRSACADPNWLSGGEEEEEEEMNFVTGIYESSEPLLPVEPIWEFDDSDRVDGTDLEFGFGSDASAGANPRSVYEDSQVNPSLVNNVVVVDDDDNEISVRVYSDFQISETDRDDFEWEEVNERVQFDDREALSSVIDRIDEISIEEETETIHFDDEGDTLISAIDQIDEVSISSNITFQGENLLLGGDAAVEEEEEEDASAVEWEVLLAMNDLDRSFEFYNSNGTNINNNEAEQLNPIDYDALFGQFVDNEIPLRGSPPASKSVVENLPLVELSMVELKENGVEVVCAVCKDEVVVEEKVTRLPCTHLYHGECILPWLKIRNTCPVCRYELPTDDAEYEMWKSERGRGSGAITGFRYNFELLP